MNKFLMAILLILVTVIFTTPVQAESINWVDSDDEYITEYEVQIRVSSGTYVRSDGVECAVTATRVTYSGSFDFEWDCPDADSGSAPGVQNGAIVTIGR